MEIIFSLSARIDSQDLVAWPIRNAWSWQVIADTSRGDEVVAESPRPFLPQRTAVEASVAELLVHQALITVVTQASRLSSEPRTPSTDQLQRDLNSRHVEISSALYALHEARMQAVSAAR
ncbi:hypothetical protein D8Y23_08905 [Microbacterium enclense]|uniref:Uncharacterized protein n=2 Tax=Microbacterium enclense TaxID=993073 RepID=A0A3S3P4M4_9MICO|nr:hypothetical protein D8Y23_08905 [Microbacterium enclense]